METTGWFLPHDPTSISDDLEVQNICGYLYTGGIEPSSAISELGQDQLYRLLPTSLRTCLRAHEMLRRWLLSKLVERRLGLQVRQARMEKLLRALELSRSTSNSVGTPSVAAVRSFAEAVITAVILSPESRAHNRAWMEVGIARNRSLDSVTSILSQTLPVAPSRVRTLTADLGWFVERLLEAISMPNAIEENGKPMVNLDKRRWAL
jgi:GTPase-activating protein BEM2